MFWLRCSSLFSVAVEWKLHPDEDESGLFRSRLQLFTLAGGASRSDLRGSVLLWAVLMSCSGVDVSVVPLRLSDNGWLLSRVSPLVKVVEHITCGGAASDKLLPLLLCDALTGNSRTVLIYIINPQGKLFEGPSHTSWPIILEPRNDCICLSGLLGGEASSALNLAQKVRSLVTKPTTGRWCPRAAEQEIRDNIMNLRTVMMSEGENNAHNTYRLAELMHNLQVCLYVSSVATMSKPRWLIIPVASWTDSEESVMGQKEGGIKQDKG